MSVNDRSLPCEATTEQGERCALPALPGSPYCLEHQEDAVAIVDEVMITVTESSVTGQGVEEEIVAAVASSATIAGKNGDLQLSDDELRAKIREEIRRLSQRVVTQAPGQTETNRAESGLLQMMRDSLSGITDSEWLDPASWQGIAMVAQTALDMQRDFVARRLRGDVLSAQKTDMDDPGCSRDRRGGGFRHPVSYLAVFPDSFPAAFDRPPRHARLCRFQSGAFGGYGQRADPFGSALTHADRYGMEPSANRLESSGRRLFGNVCGGRDHPAIDT